MKVSDFKALPCQAYKIFKHYAHFHTEDGYSDLKFIMRTTRKYYCYRSGTCLTTGSLLPISTNFASLNPVRSGKMVK